MLRYQNIIKQISFLIFLLFWGEVYSQNEIVIRGKISDSQSNEAIQGVVVVSGSTGAVSDVDGLYSFKLNAKKGQEIVVNFSMIGYDKLLRKIVIKNDSITLNVKLNSSDNLLNQIVVSAGRYEQEIKKITVSTEIVRPYLVESRLTTNMEKLVDQIPGVNVIDGQINIRGGSGWTYGAGSRVLVLVDDLPFLSGDAAFVSWKFLPLEGLEQVEVIKGASSVLYGSSALNGIINFRTSFARSKPITKVNFISGFYDDADRKSLNWSKTNRYQRGFNIFHSRKIKTTSVALSANYNKDDGYRFGDTEHRFRTNINTRFISNKIRGLNYGINAGFLASENRSFLLWESYDQGYMILDSLSNATKSININIDPYVSFYRNGFGHNIKTRYLRISNDIQSADTTVNQDNSSDFFYGEYQIQKRLEQTGTKITSGLVYMATISNSPLYTGLNKAGNTAVFLQFDQSVGSKLNLNGGLRLERHSINKVSETKPVFRAGVNYEISRYTFLRSSFGQGFRFPSIAEKFILTSVGELNIFPNPSLKAETGYNAEIGIKQGFSIGLVRGFIDAAVFKTGYQNMIEFNFGVWSKVDPFDPFKSLGFKSINVGNTEITGADLSVNAEGGIGKAKIMVLAGYTYINPIIKEPDFVFASDSNGNNYSFRNTRSDSTNTLKYRYNHILKADVQVNINRYSCGMSLRYNSFMQNIDRAFIDLPLTLFLKGVQTARDKAKNGDLIFDLRGSYEIRTNLKCSFIISNLLNREVMTRPADLRPPRMFSLQLGWKI